MSALDDYDRTHAKLERRLRQLDWALGALVVSMGVYAAVLLLRFVTGR